MGFHSRYAWPFLILLAVSFSANSAVRVQSNATATQTRQAITQTGATTPPSGYSFQTPNGEAAFFGQEHVDYHTAGNRYQAGQSVPTSGATSSSSGAVKVKVRPVSYLNKAKTAAKAVAGLRGGIPGIVATAAVGWAIEQIPGATIQNEELKKNPSSETIKYWLGELKNGTNRYPTVDLACKSYNSSNYVSGSNGVGGMYCRNTFGTVVWTITEQTQQCPNGSTNNLVCDASPTPSPFTNEDYAALAAALASVQNSEWLRDLTEKSCQGSNNPAACYDELTSWGTLLGPTSQSDSPKTVTTTTTLPDGTTSTTATTTQNTYNYKYGSQHFDVTTTTTTTTNTDGEVTTTTTTDQQPENEPPSETQEQPEPEEDEQQYQFTDTSLPEITPFYQQQYPDGLSGVWQQRKSELDNSPFLEFLQSFVPSFSGTCPTFGLDFNMGQWLSAGHIDFMSLCFVFDFIKIILLVSAVFLARSLVFGG